MKRTLLLTSSVILVILLALPSIGFSRSPLGGLTGAVSPDGKTIVVGGDSRTLYVFDGASLEVRDRIWLGATIWSIFFNKDGNRLLVSDTGDTVHLINTDTWKSEKEVEKAGRPCSARAADLFAGLGYRAEVIDLYSMTDGSKKGSVKVDQKVAAFGLNADGTRLGLLTKGEKDEAEKEVKYNDIPKDLKGIEKKAFQQKNDGKTAVFHLFEVPSGKELHKAKIFYTARAGSTLLFDGDAAVIVGYGNVNARIDPEGDIEIFATANSLNYGIGVSPDQKVIGTGGLRNGSYTQVDGLEAKTFKISKLPGWPEYFKGFAFDGEGNAYGFTSGYRMIKIRPDGAIEKEVPVY